MPDFVPIDFVFFGILLIFALIALFRGFIKEVFGKAAWILGLVAGVLFFSKVSLLFQKIIKYKILCNILGFLAVFIVVFLVIEVIGKLISAVCEFDVIKSLDRGLGFLFGLVEGIAIVAVIIFILDIQPFFSVEKILSDSFFYNIYLKLLNSPDVAGTVVENA